MGYRKCRACGKLFTHPDSYHGRCEDCYADVCAHEDSVSRQLRKSSPGEEATFHVLHENGAYRKKRYQGGKVTLW